MPIKAVIFDLYKTLIDPTGTKNPDRETYQFLQKKLQVSSSFTQFREVKETIYLKYFKKRDTPPFEEIDPKDWWAEIFSLLGVEDNLITDEALESIIRLRNEIWMPRTRLYPEVSELIEHLKTKFKLRLGIITNISRGDFARKNMDYLGISEHFDVILTSEEFGIRKPNPVIFQSALEGLQVESDEALFCGDTRWDDIKGANDAGIRSVFVQRLERRVPEDEKEDRWTTGSRVNYVHPVEIEADYTVQDLSELVPIIYGINSSGLR